MVDRLRRAYCGGLGHSEPFQHGQAKREIPANQIWSDRRCTGQQVPNPVNADHFANVVNHQNARDRELDFQPQRFALARQDALGNFMANANAPAVRHLLQFARVFQGDHHA